MASSRILIAAVFTGTVSAKTAVHPEEKYLVAEKPSTTEQTEDVGRSVVPTTTVQVTSQNVNGETSNAVPSAVHIVSDDGINNASDTSNEIPEQISRNTQEKDETSDKSNTGNQKREDLPANTEQKNNNEANRSRRRSSAAVAATIEIGGDGADEDAHQESDEVSDKLHWLIATGLFSVVFSSVGFLTAYGQLLDQKGIDSGLLRADVQGARELIKTPEVTSPCLDSVQAACQDQYFYGSFFILCGLYLFLDGLHQVHTGCLPATSNTAVAKNENENKTSMLQKLMPTLYGFLQTGKEYAKENILYKQMMSTKLGGEKYWTTNNVVLLVDIVLQCMRCFVVEESYSVTSAPHTLAQIIVMMLHINLSMLVYYMRSDVGSMAINWTADVSYLIIRFSLNGVLSMRSSGPLDFMITAMTFVFLIKEIYKAKKYILKPNNHVEPEDLHSQKKNKTRRLVISLVTAAVATILGSYGSNITLEKSQHACVAGANADTSDVGFPLPLGVLCLAWSFNLFLDPPCSCEYLAIRAISIYDCSVFKEDPEHKELDPVLDHMKDVRFLIVTFDPACPNIPEDFNLITSFTRLRFLVLSGLDLPELPSNFKDLNNLIAIEVSRSNLEKISKDMLESWPQLESFGCTPCPYLDSTQVFEEAHLPRLQTLELYGVASCPDVEAKVKEVRCVDRSTSTVCNSAPDWFVQSFVDRIEGAVNSECYEPRCSDAYYYFDGFSDEFGLVSTINFQTLVAAGPLRDLYSSYPYQAWACVVSEIRNANPLQLHYYQDMHGKLTIVDYAAWGSSWTNCYDCPYVKDFLEEGDKNFKQASNNSDHQQEDKSLPQECLDVWGAYPPADISTFGEYCSTSNGACEPYCGLAISMFSENDIDQDGHISEEQYATTAAIIGVNVPTGTYACWRALGGAGCFDSDQDLDSGLELARALALAMWLVGQPSTTCSDCATQGDPSCEDVDGFTDVKGYDCSGWIGFDCIKQWSGYSEQDMQDLQENCKSSCWLCEH